MKFNFPSQPYHKNVNPNHPGFKIRPPHDVFPEDIECVFQGQNGKGAIYLGNLEAAESLQTLKKLKIKSLLTACKNIYIRHPKEHVPYSLYIPGEDHENYDLSVHFETAINFIHESRKQTNILVHCMAGISRSATLVIAYLIKFHELPFSHAISMLRQKRSKVNPNPGFVRQLKKWQEKHLHQKAKSRKSQQRKQQQKYQQNNYSKSKYDSFYSTSKKYLPNKNNEKYQYTYLTQNLQPSKVHKTIQHSNYSNYKKFNPENEIHYYKNPHFDTNSHIKSSIYNTNGNVANPNVANRLAFQSRVKEALSNITNSKVCQTTNLARDRSLDVLGKDLDERIAKIKQKYYEASANLGISKIENKYEQSYIRNRQYNRNYEQNKRINSTYQRANDQKRLYNNYVGDNLSLARSRANRESLRNSAYNPSYNGSRTITYQYG